MQTGTHPEKDARFIILGIVLSGVIFCIEYFLSAGIGTGAAYVIVVMLTINISRKPYIYLFGTLVSLLALVVVVIPNHETLAIGATRYILSNRVFTVIGIWVAVYYILKFKSVQSQAFKSIERMNALFQYATEGIVITGGKGEIIMVNPEAEKQFGYKKEELLGRRIEILIPERFAGKHVDHRKSYYTHPRARYMGSGMALFAKRKDGSEFPVEISLSSFSTSEGHFVVSFIIDITIRRQQEEKLHLANEGLKQYAQRLQESNTELEQFAYVSSHDLQEPLRKIQAYGDRILQKEAERVSQQGKEYIERMLNAASRMQNLINDLLTFSRISTKAKPFEKVNLDEVLKGVLSDLEVAIAKSDAKIEVPVPLPVIDADPMQMRQLLQNLVANAIKFRKEEENPIVNIKYKRYAIGETKRGVTEMLEIKVEDNGIGFDEKYNDKIFTIFQRLEGQKYEGSGIGLAICKKIALRHGGDIIAQSQPGKGSVFTVTLAMKH